MLLGITAIYSAYTLYHERYRQVISEKELSSAMLAERFEVGSLNYLNLFYGYVVNNQIRNILVDWGVNGKDLTNENRESLRAYSFTNIAINPNIGTIEIYNLQNGEVFVTQRSESSLIKKHAGFWAFRDPRKQNTLAFVRDGNDVLAVHQLNSFPESYPIALLVLRFREFALESNTTAFLFNDANQIIQYNLADAYDNKTEVESIARHILGEMQDRGMSFIHTEDYFAFYNSIHGGRLQLLQLVPNSVIADAIVESVIVHILVATVSLITAIIFSIVLSRLINKSYKSTIEKERVQLKALQAQINPHFMFNTLQVMGSMAVDVQAMDLYSTTTALADMMRYSLDFSKEFIPLSLEMDHMFNYIFIQNKRFDNQIHLENNLNQQALICSVPKLIIQPLIENILEHGFPNKKEHCGIHIYEKKSEKISVKDLCIVIKDNGVGISEYHLEKIRDRLLNYKQNALFTSGNIGLVNIHSRLKFKYGNPYGLSISSSLNKGTEVEVLLRREYYAQKTQCINH